MLEAESSLRSRTESVMSKGKEWNHTLTIYGQQSLLSLSGHIRVGFLTVHHLAQKDTALPLDVHARVHAQWI